MFNFNVEGVRLGCAAAGIRYRERDDLVLLELPVGARVAGMFTRNAFCAAPVSVAKRHLSDASPRYLLINAGNANAGTGQAGIADALACCAEVARLGDCRPEQVLPFSTGVIGERLPMDAMRAGIAEAFEHLKIDGWQAAAWAILTTDTRPKLYSHQLRLSDGRLVGITGIAKGSGMIRPDMATLLAFLATDVELDPAFLDECLRDAVADSFNAITVDGDTSTNDACVLVASGRSGGLADEDRAPFKECVVELCEWLAQALVRDAEGATKFITVEVVGGMDKDECRQVAYTLAHSPLVKTAFFAGDANWGRILAAVGRAGLGELDVAAVDIYLDDVCIVRGGGRAEDYSEERGSAVMANEDITVRIELLKRGGATARLWTSDLSHDYVRINAEYRS